MKGFWTWYIMTQHFYSIYFQENFHRSRPIVNPWLLNRIQMDVDWCMVICPTFSSSDSSATGKTTKIVMTSHSHVRKLERPVTLIRTAHRRVKYNSNTYAEVACYLGPVDTKRKSDHPQHMSLTGLLLTFF